VPIVIIFIDIIVVVLPVSRPGIIGRVDVDAVYLSSMSELECFEDMVVLALDDYMCRLVTASLLSG
jgi:hypothetical protein